MSILAIAIIATASIWIISLRSISKQDYYGTRTTKQNINSKSINLNTELEQLSQSFNFLHTLIGQQAISKLIVISVVIVTTSCIFLGPYLSNNKIGWLIGLIVSLAYILRVIFHMASNYRITLLSQLQRILYSIRNSLSTGATLDNAVNNSVKHNPESPLGPHLQSFIKVSEANFTEKFPQWLENLRHIFKLKELSESAQLLALELQHTNNQENAFINAANFIENREKINKKQKNTLLITMVTMDFLVLCFLWIVFFIIPQINDDWWSSPSRITVMLQSSLAIWTIYAATVAIALGRQA